MQYTWGLITCTRELYFSVLYCTVVARKFGELTERSPLEAICQALEPFAEKTRSVVFSRHRLSRLKCRLFVKPKAMSSRCVFVHPSLLVWDNSYLQLDTFRYCIGTFWIFITKPNSLGSLALWRTSTMFVSLSCFLWWLYISFFLLNIEYKACSVE